jgi:type IV pilus assembly protein PilF
MIKRFFPAFSILILLAFILSGCATNKAATKERALALRNLGASLVREGNVRSGLENLLKAAELDPTDSDTQHELAMAYSELGEYQLSLNHFDKALALRPRFPQAWNNKGTVHLRLRQWDQAIDCFQKAVEDILYRTPHFAYNNLGLAYHMKGQYQKAIESYKKALKFSPGYSPARVNLGLTLERIDRWEDAMDAYKTAISFDSTYPPAHFYLGRLYLNRNKKTEAAQELLETIRLDPKGRLAQEAKNLSNTMK